MFFYHAIVRQILSGVFAKLQRTRSGNHIAAQFACNGVFRFAGDSELGGELRGPEAVASWFERAFTLFPDLTISPEMVELAGGPWNTRVTTRLHVTASLPDGTPYENDGIQFLRLRFGKIVEDRIFEDTAVLDRALAKIANFRDLAKRSGS